MLKSSHALSWDSRGKFDRSMRLYFHLRMLMKPFWTFPDLMMMSLACFSSALSFPDLKSLACSYSFLTCLDLSSLGCFSSALTCPDLAKSSIQSSTFSLLDVWMKSLFPTATIRVKQNERRDPQWHQFLMHLCAFDAPYCVTSCIPPQCLDAIHAVNVI